MIRHLEPEPDERIRLISDVHLGHVRSTVENVETLRPLLHGCDRLIVCGDLAETRACAFQAKGMAMKRDFASMCREEGVILHTLAGNHDPLEETSVLKLYGGSVVALHGHALYKVGAPWGWEYLNHKQACRDLIARHPMSDTDLEDRMALAREMALLSPPVLQRPRVSKNRVLRFLAHCGWPPSRPIAILRAWMTMSSLMHRFTEQFFPEARIVCFGHFHRPGQWKRAGRLYVNTGAFFKNARPSIVDLSDGRVTGIHTGSLLTTKA